MTVKRPQPYLNPWDLLTEDEAARALDGEVIDWWPVFNRSAELGPASRDLPGITVLFPPGLYAFSDTWRVRRNARVEGAGGGGWFAGTVLLFPHGKAGVEFEWLDGRSDWSRFKYVRLVEYGVQDPGGNAHGVIAKAPIVIDGVCVQGFVHGIYLRGNASDPVNPSNCNTFRVSNVRLDGNYGSGLLIEGADANAGVTIGVDASDNGRYGIEDNSFLGNTHVGPHCDNNRLGAIRNVGANAYSTIVGAYAEGNQPASQVGAPAIAIGGLSSYVGTGGFVTMGGGELAVNRLGARNAATPGQRTMVRLGPSSTLPGDAASWVCEDTTQTYRLRYGAYPGWWTQQYQALDSGHVFGLCTAAAPHYNQGRQGPKVLLGDTYIAGMLNAAGTEPPTTGSWPLGARVHNTAPAVGGYEGWICVAAGTPGTWRPFGKIE